jgi:hypothetical protein
MSLGAEDVVVYSEVLMKGVLLLDFLDCRLHQLFELLVINIIPVLDDAGLHG